MIEDLIIKFISRTANIEELCLLMKYLENKKNVEIFKSFIKINYFSIYTMQNIDRKEILEIVQKRISSEHKRKRREKIYLKVFKYAAILTTFFGLGYYYNTFQSQNNTAQIITPNEDNIVLTTSEGTKIILNEDQKKCRNRKSIEFE